MAVYSRQACSVLPTLLGSCFVLLSRLGKIRALSDSIDKVKRKRRYALQKEECVGDAFCGVQGLE